MASSLQFWKPGTQGPGSLLDRATESEEAVIHALPNSAALGIQAQRERLPIFKHREKILYCVEQFGVTIVVGETGCGKTTQLPQYLYEAGWAPPGSVIACTQPRRVAATSVATRVAAEVGTILGDEVGYTIRFEDVSDKTRTRICYMTDGMLFRETMIDPLLSRYSVIMIDEAHERSIYTDLLLGVLKKIRRKRPSLRLIISSATLDAQSFLDFFNSNTAVTGSKPVPSEKPDATIISLEGRMFPVEVAYLSEPVSDYVREAVRTIWAIHLQAGGPGDILVFLTGREEIDRCLQELSDLLPELPRGYTRLQPLALHAGLPTDEQLLLFSSKDYKCGEEILTIAAMVAVQDVFIIPDGAPGALAELERRKFTAEEGDHLTLLNAYNAFVRYGKGSSWCKSHALSFRAMSRAVSIRAQLKKYMQRFNLPLQSCEGDAKRLRQCLVSGYWRNGARWVADGTYRSVRGDKVLHVHPNSVMFTRKPKSGWVVFHEIEETKKTQ
ncbi:hypothetical protein M422DRAFT_164154 [Sphaerobolus stellatus SS14]|nr:hypothetical protein M422DRAFT_164154 [Sphaerobolus stellatus SS14]